MCGGDRVGGGVVCVCVCVCLSGEMVRENEKWSNFRRICQDFLMAQIKIVREMKS